MALNARISLVAAQAACDAIVDLVDAHATLAGYLEVRSGAQPASVDAAASGTLLSTIGYNDPAFSAAADAAPGAVATADTSPAMQDTSAVASGTAGYCRVYDGSDVGILDGEAGTGTHDFVFDNTSIAIGQTVTLNSHTVTMPES